MAKLCRAMIIFRLMYILEHFIETFLVNILLLAIFIAFEIEFTQNLISVEIYWWVKWQVLLKSIFIKFSDFKDMLYLAFIPVHLFLICLKYSSLSHAVIFCLENTYLSSLWQTTPQSNPHWFPKSMWMFSYEFMWYTWLQIPYHISSFLSCMPYFLESRHRIYFML